MSNRRGIFLEIEGCTTGFTSNETAGALAGATWATSVIEAISAIPSSQSMAVDPFSGTFQNGGTDLQLTREAGILLVRSESPITTLTTDASATDLFLAVDETAFFPATGNLWIDQEAITYTGKTPAPGALFVPVVRGALGTTAAAHKASVGTASTKNKVYGFNTHIIGRSATISFYDPDSSLPSMDVKFRGVIDDFEFSGDGFTLRLISNSKLFIDAEAYTKKPATGKFEGAFFKGSKTPLRGLPPKATNPGGLNAIFVSVDDDRPFPSTGINGKNQTLYYKINDEIFQYLFTRTPSGTVGSGTAIGSLAPFGRYFTTTGEFFTGDKIRWLDGSTYVTASIVKINELPFSNSERLEVFHTADRDPAPGATVEALGRQILSPLFRAKAGTEEGDHKIGDDVTEVGYIRGNHVVVALQLMLSTGTGTNGNYDVLPEGFGAGISQNLVDVFSFERLIPDVIESRFFIEEPLKISEMLARLARITGARIYVNTEGILTAKLERELWPDTSIVGTVTTDKLERDSFPVWHPQMANLFNAWTFRGNALKGGTFRDEAHFENAESVNRYGRRPLEDYEDPNMRLARDISKLEVLAWSVLQRWATPNPILELTILNSQDQPIWDPGQIVTVDFPHLPDQAGGAGITASCEVLEWTPQDSSGTIQIRLAMMPLSLDVRLVSPAGEITAVASSVITIAAGSISKLAPPSGKTGLGSLVQNTGADDIDYFKTGLPIMIIDRSAPANRHSTTVAAIDYGLRSITLASLPAWTIAPGDIVKHDAYPAVVSYDQTYTRTFLYLADNSTEKLNGDPPHVWGR